MSFDSPLYRAIISQAEYYFDNIKYDPLLSKLVEESKDGWVDSNALLNFNRLHNLCWDVETLEVALSGSKKLEVDTAAHCVRMRRDVQHPVDGTEARTLIVDRLPLESTLESISNLFSAHGTVLHVHAPHFKALKQTDEKHLKGYAVVVMERKEDAEKAVAEINGTPSLRGEGAGRGKRRRTDEGIRVYTRRQIDDLKDEYKELQSLILDWRSSSAYTHSGHAGSSVVGSKVCSRPSPIDFTGCVFSFSLEPGPGAPLKSKHIRTVLDEIVSVAYVDMKEHDSGHVRFTSKKDSMAFLDFIASTPIVVSGRRMEFNALNDEECVGYWSSVYRK